MTIIFLLIVACLLAGCIFVIIYKSDKELSEYERLPVALDAGQMVSFVLGILLYLVFPLSFSVSCSINVWIGALIGVLFCSLNGRQSIAGGFFYGGLAAIMGTMVGASAINPAICGLPLSKLPIQNPELAIGTLSVVLLFISVLLVKYSQKMNIGANHRSV